MRVHIRIENVSGTPHSLRKQMKPIDSFTADKNLLTGFHDIWLRLGCALVQINVASGFGS